MLVVAMKKPPIFIDFGKSQKRIICGGYYEMDAVFHSCGVDHLG